jgi:hypothetical protein
VNDKRWESVVRPSELERSPRWAASADSPPLAPRAAVRSARQLVDALFTAGEKWDLGRLSLQQIIGVRDSWIYLVEFGEHPTHVEGMGSFIGETMTVVVLMDGTAIRPIGYPLKKH